ncbi:MAG: hypothetical protein ACFHX7_22060 [Pseudomonadota bacterium]
MITWIRWLALATTACAFALLVLRERPPIAVVQAGSRVVAVQVPAAAAEVPRSGMLNTTLDFIDVAATIECLESRGGSLVALLDDQTLVQVRSDGTLVAPGPIEGHQRDGLQEARQLADKGSARIVAARTVWPDDLWGRLTANLGAKGAASLSVQVRANVMEFVGDAGALIERIPCSVGENV